MSFLDFSAPCSIVGSNVFKRTPANPAAPPTFAAARRRLPQPFWDGHPAAIAAYWKAWELAFGNLNSVTATNGFIEPYIDSAFNDCLFMWDSVFTLLFCRYGRFAFDFQKTLDNIYAKQHADGFLSREIRESDGTDQFHKYDPASTGPTVLAWCEWEYWLSSRDRSRLARVYPPLLAYHQWLARHRTWPDGSYASCGLACGMDNQPRVLPGQNALMDHAWTAWVDATCQAALSARILAAMAAALGLGDTPAAAACREEADRLAAYVNGHMWDAGRGAYVDRRLRPEGAAGGAGSAPATESLAGYWALLAGVAPPDRVAALVASLDSPAVFNAPVRVPALPRRVAGYRAGGGPLPPPPPPPLLELCCRPLVARSVLAPS